MLVYRIVHKKYAQSLTASGIKGRWNSPGNMVIYSAESIALAFLENMVRRQGVGFNLDFRINIIEIPDKLKISILNLEMLDDGWRDSKDYSKCQIHGDQWYLESKTVALKIPSAVLPDSFNYIINSNHKDFKQIKLIASTQLIPDERIEQVLKIYRNIE